MASPLPARGSAVALSVLALPYSSGFQRLMAHFLSIARLLAPAVVDSTLTPRAVRIAVATTWHLEHTDLPRAEPDDQRVDLFVAGIACPMVESSAP